MTARSVVPLVTLLALVACGGVQPVVDRALQRMRAQARADAYEASAAFPDGKVMHPPPTGTIAREDALDSASAGGATARRGDAARVRLLARGRSRFRIVCAACHGAGGFGGSIVAENWWPPPRPPSLRTGPAAELPAGTVYQVVTSGFGRMPPYAPDLPPSDRWAVVAYALTLRGRAPADSAERDDSAHAARLRQLDAPAAGAMR